MSALASPAMYWTAALVRIAGARIGLKGKEPADIWRRLERLAEAEQFARECLELAGETRAAKAEAQKRQGVRNDLIENSGDTTSWPRGQEVGTSRDVAAKAVGIGRNTVERAAPAGFRFG